MNYIQSVNMQLCVCAFVVVVVVQDECLLETNVHSRFAILTDKIYQYSFCGVYFSSKVSSNGHRRVYSLRFS